MEKKRLFKWILCLVFVSLILTDNASAVLGLETISSSLRIIFLVAAAGLCWLLAWSLFGALAAGETTIQSAKLTSISMLFILLLGVFTLLFLELIAYYILIALWGVLLICIILAIIAMKVRR